MKVAISMRSVHESLLQEEMGVVDFLKYAASLAVDGVELDDIYLQGSGVSFTEIRNLLTETGLKVSCYDIHHPMKPLQTKEREQALGRIKEELAVAELLQAQHVQIVGEVFEPSVVARDVETLILDLVEMVMPFLRGKELVLAIENPSSEQFQSHQVANLLERINDPQVKVGFNMANSLVAGEDPVGALERLKDQIAHVRAVDVRLAQLDEEPQNGSYVGCVIGLGLVPLKKLFQVLQAQGYKGWIALEFTGLEEAYFGTEASLKNLRQSLAELRYDAFHPGEFTGVSW
ncbi:MAG: sugar phosphate isomerase/epimerase [Limnochordia bacterium]|nr:sugar phosphate isomerase/epimerase [Limnochordia bacterium]